MNQAYLVHLLEEVSGSLRELFLGYLPVTYIERTENVPSTVSNM